MKQLRKKYYPLIEDKKNNNNNNESYSSYFSYSYSGFGYHRSTYQAPSPIADKVINGQDFPAIITELSDDILKTAIKCEVTGKLFRIIPQELSFYRKHNIPLPRKHPDQRHKERMELRK